MAIFYEETGCCNIVQDTRPAAIGPSGERKGLEGLLKMQTGDSNVGAVDLFKRAAAALERLMQRDPTVNYQWSSSEWQAYRNRRRDAFRSALNIAKQFKNDPIGSCFTKFWEYFLPDDFLADPLGYITCGY